MLFVNPKSYMNKKLRGIMDALSVKADREDLDGLVDHDQLEVARQEMYGLIDEKADIGALATKASKAELSSKADASALAMKADISALDAKANASALTTKANVGDSYTKAQDDQLFAQKVDRVSAYIRSEVDALLAQKLNTSRVIFTTASVTIPAFTVLAVKTVTVTVNGLVVGDHVQVVPPSARPVFARAEVTAANTVTISILAVGVLTSATDSWLVIAWKKE